MNKYFLHSLAIGFFASAVTYKSWLLGLCSVSLTAILTGKELYKDYLTTKKEQDLGTNLKKILEDQARMEKKFAEWQDNLGKISFKVNAMGEYIGSPNN